MNKNTDLEENKLNIINMSKRQVWIKRGGMIKRVKLEAGMATMIWKFGGSERASKLINRKLPAQQTNREKASHTYT